MGYYIQTGTLKDKALYIIREMDGKAIPKPTSFEEIPADKALIVVVDNGVFEAAGLVYSPEEFQEFVTRDDDRGREYVLMDKERAHQEAGYTRFYDD